jgi:phosphosulfolactate phosphohydrolase-like enzyme
MIIRKVDGTNDWDFGKGKNSYATAEQAIEINIQTVLLSWVGNCFFAIDDFVDYNNLLDKGKEEDLKYAIKSQILQCEGVIKVTDISTSLDIDRKVTISYTIDTIYGRGFQNIVLQG